MEVIRSNLKEFNNNYDSSLLKEYCSDPDITSHLISKY